MSIQLGRTLHICILAAGAYHLAQCPHFPCWEAWGRAQQYLPKDALLVQCLNLNWTSDPHQAALVYGLETEELGDLRWSPELTEPVCDTGMISALVSNKIMYANDFMLSTVEALDQGQQTFL